MSPLVLVGITLLTCALADVSHIPQGSAHPHSDPQEINRALEPGRTPKEFWWMQDDSPLKASYEYFKKCAATGKCAQAKQASQSEDSDAGLGPIDIQKNAFLNGKFAASVASAGSESGSKGFHSGSSPDLSSNLFLQGGFAHAGQAGSTCSGADRICVSRQECVDGFASSRSVRKNHNIQCAGNEVCCRLPSGEKSSLADHINQLLFTPGKSKDTGKDGLTPEQVQIIHSSQEGIRPQLNLIGESSGSSTAKPVRDVTAAASQFFGSTPDYSNVEFGDDARYSDLDVAGYIPPAPAPSTTTRRPGPCPSGQYRNNGRCEPVREPCPPGTKPTPSGSCEKLRPECPSGQQPAPYGGCVNIPTPPPIRPPVICLPGQRETPSGRCENIPTPPPPTTTIEPYCPTGQRRGPNGQCVAVNPCGAGQRLNAYGACVEIPTPAPPTCPSGQKLTVDGRCVSESPPTEAPYCPPGYRNGPNGQCIKIDLCGAGQRPNGFGGCVDIPQPSPPPPPPSPPTRPPVLPCPYGQKRNPDGRCVSEPQPPTEAPYCSSGSRKGPNGQCIKIDLCGPGQRPNGFGGCVDIPKPSPPPPPPPTRPPVPPCPYGQKPTPDGRCVSEPQPPTEAPYCPSGSRKGPNGQCIKTDICGAGQRPNGFGGCVDIPKPSPPPPPPTRPPVLPCPYGQKPTPDGRCVSEPQPPTEAPYCPSGSRKGPNGQCIKIDICGAGQRPNGFGGCVDIPQPSPPPPPPPPTRPPVLPCPNGQKPTPDGRCVSEPQPPTEAPYCPSGSRKGPNGQCIKIDICGAGQRPNGFGGCVDIPQPSPPPPPPSPPTRPPVLPCPYGQKRNPDGRCVSEPQPPTEAPYCPSGSRKGPNGQCIKIDLCGAGQRPNGFGGCVDIPQPSPPPPPPQPPTRPPVVPCLYGQKRNPDGRCVSESTTTKVPYCPSGDRVGPNGQCIPIPPCGAGQRPNGFGGCVDIPQPSPPPPPPPTRPPVSPCPYGQKRNPDGRCVSESTTAIVPYCPSGERVGPNGQCIPTTPKPSPPCRPGSVPGPYGLCIEVTTTPSTTCGPGRKPGPYGGCVVIEQSTPTPCPPGTKKSPSGRCEIPTVRPPPPTTTSRNYLPPENPNNTVTPTPFRPDDSDHTPAADMTVNVVITPPTNGGGNEFNDDLIPYGCAAALKCVQEIYCTADGFVSPVPVVLTKEQELLRAPTTVCRDISSGTVGKCCRDRDYQDAWPSANLVNGVDDGRYAEDDSIGQYKAEFNRIRRASRVIPNPRFKKVRNPNSRSKRASEDCGVRNLNSSPFGQAPIDANFAEISWQAMILRDSNRSLLCGGAIIRRNAVLTAAHCIEGLETSDVLIKGGEWKLGIDEEPLPFQIVKVAAILRHPDFKAGSLQNDLAVLVLEENLRFTKNIGAICLPEPNMIPTQNCIATGWGKRILQLHAKNALMHRIDMNIMDVNQCQQVMGEHFQSSLPHYNTNTLCGFSSIDQCKVDYGSALACADETGHYTLSGIYSWDTGCRQQGQIGGYVAPDVDWIQTVLDTPLKQLRRLDRAYNTARTAQL